MTETGSPDGSAAGAWLAGVPVVDAHHHFWQLSRFPYRWLRPSAPPARFGDKTSLQSDYLPPRYLFDMAGVPLRASVHVQANCGADDPVEETRWLQDLSGRTGWPTAAVAEVDLTGPEACATIDRHAAFPILRGIRTPVAWDSEGRWRVAGRPGVLSEAGFGQAARHLADRGLCLECVVVPEQLGEVLAFAQAHPALTIVINHFATLEPSRPGVLEHWQAGLTALRAAPNVYLKLSGLWTVDKGWSPDVLRPLVTFVLETLGSARLMYGSNMPVEGVNCPVPRQFEHLAQVLEGRDPSEIRHIFGRTASGVYGLDL